MQPVGLGHELELVLPRGVVPGLAEPVDPEGPAIPILGLRVFVVGWQLRWQYHRPTVAF